MKCLLAFAAELDPRTVQLKKAVETGSVKNIWRKRGQFRILAKKKDGMQFFRTGKNFPFHNSDARCYL